MNRVLTVMLLLFCTVLPGEMAFADGQTEPERLAEQLSESTDQKERALGKRWEGLIRRRQWTSASGKHKTFAKYVDHAPDLSWVKLLVLTKSGDEKTEKEVQIPLEKLDKKGRAVLGRIALRRKEVEAVLASSESTSDERRAASDSGRQQPASANHEQREEPGYEPRYEPRDERGYEPGEEQRYEPRYEPRGIRPGEEYLPDPNRPILPDNAPWRKSYEKFIGNLSATKIDPEGDEHDRATWKLDWGELQAIRRVWAYESIWLKIADGEGPREEAEKKQRFAEEARPQVGEVVWEGVLKSRIRPSARIDFDFPKPPEPFRIFFSAR